MPAKTKATAPDGRYRNTPKPSVVGRDGNRRWDTEIVARDMVSLTTNQGGGGNQGGNQGGGSTGGGADIPYADDEDIPF